MSRQNFFLISRQHYRNIQHNKLIKNKSTAGHDGISNELLKLVASVVSYHVAKLINRSIQEGFFQVCLKTAKIIPLHKMEVLKTL